MKNIIFNILLLILLFIISIEYNNMIFFLLLLILFVVCILIGIINSIIVRYYLIGDKKTIINVSLENQNIIKLYYDSNKEKEIIQKIYLLIKNELKNTGYVKKYNGYYLILLKYTNKSKIIHLIDQINYSVSSLMEDEIYTISLQYGIQICDKDGFFSNENKATIACNIAKRENMSYYSFYDEVDVEEKMKEKKVLNDLVNSLKNREFEVYFQPKYDYKEKKIVGSEALARLVKDGNVIPTKDFIDVAEKYGFITYLDKYILVEVCKKIVEMKKNQIDFHCISINVSRNTLCENNIIEYYNEILKKYGIKKDEIEFEITERNENGFVSSKKKIEEMSKMFNVSIDDFGVENSSLSMLLERNIKTIKIDRQFVIDESELGKKLLNNIIKLIKDNNFQIVAEGVETKEQMEYLYRNGCTTIQGYYYSKPLSYEEYKQKILDEKK